MQAALLGGLEREQQEPAQSGGACLQRDAAIKIGEALLGLLLEGRIIEDQPAFDQGQADHAGADQADVVEVGSPAGDQLLAQPVQAAPRRAQAVLIAEALAQERQDRQALGGEVALGVPARRAEAAGGGILLADQPRQSSGDRLGALAHAVEPERLLAQLGKPAQQEQVAAQAAQVRPGGGEVGGQGRGGDAAGLVMIAGGQLCPRDGGAGELGGGDVSARRAGSGGAAESDLEDREGQERRAMPGDHRAPDAPAARALEHRLTVGGKGREAGGGADACQHPVLEIDWPRLDAAHQLA